MEWPAFMPAYCEPRWYAAYTCANHEKRVAEQLCVREVEHFFPVYSSVRRWKDRRVMLDLPLFPGYVFVRMAIRDRLRVQTVPGVARLVGFNGTPAALPDEEIEGLRTAFGGTARGGPHPYLISGTAGAGDPRAAGRDGRGDAPAQRELASGDLD